MALASDQSNAKSGAFLRGNRCCSCAAGCVFSARFASPQARAALAQPVEHVIRNDGVACSSHAGGTTFSTAENRRRRGGFHFANAAKTTLRVVCEGEGCIAFTQIASS